MKIGVKKVAETKPRRVKELEEEADLIGPCDKVGEFRGGELGSWETWLCIAADRSVILVQEHDMPAFDKTETSEIHLTEDEQSNLEHTFAYLRKRKG